MPPSGGAKRPLIPQAKLRWLKKSGLIHNPVFLNSEEEKLGGGATTVIDSETQTSEFGGGAWRRSYTVIDWETQTQMSEFGGGDWRRSYTVIDRETQMSEFGGGA